MTDVELRIAIVTALNLTPLVPPQADTPTLNIVDDAWYALSTLMTRLKDSQTKVEHLEKKLEYWELMEDEKAQLVNGLMERVRNLEREELILTRERDKARELLLSADAALEAMGSRIEDLEKQRDELRQYIADFGKRMAPNG